MIRVPCGIADLVAAAAEVDAGEVLLREPEDAGDLLPERGHVPGLDVGLAADVPLDDVVEQVLGEPHHVAARVDRLVFVDADLALEHFAPQRVDALALLVHHVVVLEQVLADREVLRLDLLLRALDRARHHLVLDRDALLHPEPLHEARDAVGAEDPHQVVFEREIEARRAGIALPAGAAAQLVVDAARLVPLGAEDVQAANLDHLLVLGLGLATEEPVDALPVGPRHPVEVVDVEEVDELLVVDEPRLAARQLLGDLLARLCCRAMNSALPPSRMSVPRPAMLVAIVTAPLRPACATISASCAWYLAFSTMCLMPRLLSIVESRSDFSIETVPTSTGRPFCCFSRISSTTASYFSRSVR